MWTPENSVLITTDELKSFFKKITYTYTDEELDGTFIASVSLQPLESNPETVNIDGSVVSGYYKDSFTYSVEYMQKQNSYVTVDRFREVDPKNLKEVISYEASLIEDKTFTYRATARDKTNTVIDTKDYTIVVSNNWTPGKDALQQLVQFTKTPQDTLVVWSSGTQFINSFGQTVTWETSL
jgi:hypothetical protein